MHTHTKKPVMPYGRPKLTVVRNIERSKEVKKEIEVKENEILEYTIGDGRKVVVSFNPEGDNTNVVETFEAEETNPIEMQRGGWQAILDSFKRYVENN